MRYKTSCPLFLKLTLFLLIITISSKAQKAFRWPGNKKAAIVLTYDDALQSQLNIALPQLDSLHLKGTFFLTGNMTETDISKWRNAAKNGHELGNHTLYHPCRSSAFAADAHYQSDNYNLKIILREISAMNNFLFAIDNKSGRTYAFPCTETSVGGKDYTDTLARSGLIKYARGGGDSNAVITDFKHINKFVVPSWGFGYNPNESQLISFVKKVQRAGGLGVFMFHGVGGDYLQVTDSAHKKLLEYLNSKQKEVWVATFQEVMDYVIKNSSK